MRFYFQYFVLANSHIFICLIQIFINVDYQMKSYQLVLLHSLKTEFGNNAETGKKEHLYLQSSLDLGAQLISSEFSFFPFWGSAFCCVAFILQFHVVVPDISRLIYFQIEIHRCENIILLPGK